MKDPQLLSINSQNWHGLGEGVDPAVAADLGYIPFDEMDEIHEGIERYKQALEAVSSPVVEVVHENPYHGVTPVETPGLNTGHNNPWNEPLSRGARRKIQAARTPEEQAVIDAAYVRGLELARAALKAAQEKKRQDG